MEKLHKTTFKMQSVENNYTFLFDIDFGFSYYSIISINNFRAKSIIGPVCHVKMTFEVMILTAEKKSQFPSASDNEEGKTASSAPVISFARHMVISVYLR